MQNRKPQYAPVIALNSSSEEIQPFVLNYTAKRLVYEITVHVLDPPKSGQKPDKFLVTFNLMNKNKKSKNLPPFYLYKPDILANLKDSAHQYIMFLDEFFLNMERVFKVEEPYGGDKRMEHPNPKRLEYKNFHQMTATVLTIKEGMTVLQQVEKELARVIDLFPFRWIPGNVP